MEQENDLFDDSGFQVVMLCTFAMHWNQYKDFKNKFNLDFELFKIGFQMVRVSIKIAKMYNETDVQFCKKINIKKLKAFIIKNAINDGMCRLQLISEWDCRTFGVPLEFIEIVHELNFPFVVDYVFLE